MSAEQHISPQDYELLSAYIDGELTDDARASLEQRLTTEPTLQRELSSLRNTVNLIHQLQPITAPRNFTLTADMVTPKNVIQLQPRRRRVRPDYLSLVASVLLMLFGVMFMLSELSQPAAPQASDAAPPPSAAQVEAPAVANVPTEPVEAPSPVNREVDEAEVQSADEASMEKIEVDETKLPSPLLNQTLADDSGAAPEMRLETIDEESNLAGEGFTGADSELDTFAAEETDDTTNTTASSDTQLFDTVTAEDMQEEAEEPAAAAGGAMMMQSTAISDTTTEMEAEDGTADQSNDTTLGAVADDDIGAADDRTDTIPEIASQVSNPEETHTLETPADILIPSEPPGQSEQSGSAPFTGIEIGLGLLSIGLILLVTSLMIIRRNRS